VCECLCVCGESVFVVYGVCVSVYVCGVWCVRVRL